VLSKRSSWLAIGAFALAACGNDASPNPPAIATVDLRCPADPVSPTPLRRLTRFEYANTVRDLVGIDLDIDEMFPPDEISLFTSAAT
jgi:hypothetical protein